MLKDRPLHLAVGLCKGEQIVMELIIAGAKSELAVYAYPWQDIVPLSHLWTHFG